MKKLLLLAFCLLAFPAFGQTLASPGGGSSATFPTICPAPVASGQILYDNAGACGGITGWTTNGTTAITGAASTTLAIGGATIGSNALAVTGTIVGSSTIGLGAGVAGTPSITLAGDTAGWYRNAASQWTWAAGSANQISLISSVIRMSSGVSFGWSSGDSTTSQDLILVRDAANTLAQRNGVNAQTLRVYGSFTDSSNGDWFSIAKAAGGNATLGTVANGTGTAANLIIQTGATSGILSLGNGGVEKIYISSLGITFPTDNTYDIGASGSTRPRTGYFGTQLFAAGTQLTTSKLAFASTSSFIQFATQGVLQASSDGVFFLSDNAGTSFGRLQFGGTTNLFPSLKRSTTTLGVRLADDSADAGITMSTIVASGITQITNATDSTTTTSGSLQVAGGAAIIKRVFIPGITASAGLQTAVLCQSSGGEMIADSVACLASSARFKNLAGPMEDGALTKLAALPMRRWNYKPEGIFHNDVEHVGPIAEDVAAMDPRLAGYDKDGRVRTYSTEQLLAYTIKALQELKADNDNLRQEMKRIAR